MYMLRCCLVHWCRVLAALCTSSYLPLGHDNRVELFIPNIFYIPLGISMQNLEQRIPHLCFKFSYLWESLAPYASFNYHIELFFCKKKVIASFSSILENYVTSDITVGIM